jgi:hypothetical protein
LIPAGRHRLQAWLLRDELDAELAEDEGDRFFRAFVAGA